MYNDRVWVDTSHIVLSYEGYEKTSSVTIERGFYSAMRIAEVIRDGFNDIDGYQVFAREKNRGYVQMGPRSGIYPSMVVISNDNPYLPLKPGLTRTVNSPFIAITTSGCPD